MPEEYMQLEQGWDCAGRGLTIVGVLKQYITEMQHWYRLEDEKEIQWEDSVAMAVPAYSE